ncbi:mRNA-decapping enzyme 1B isoform X1 [Electrophorus electricus]|uniref:5'-(N(7)-methylguanosine 5'-triphospho)-[mRNA] hydrolase n=1 Tax=Electrophorus electricus TaxID=8005 RepID=A0A4W4F8M8_ELEEL|nr:mRNA-decapping enzyme 1B isoform X1 [Electrophorus electricus]
MTASYRSTCLATKGLDISLAALQRQDPYINNIIDVASQVALYSFNNETNEWEKTDVEGTLFVYTRLASPKHGFTIMNRLSMDNLTEPITKDLDFQLQDPFLLYRNARLSIYGIWFYDKEDCQRIAELTKTLTRQEQQLHTQSQCGWVSPQRLESREGKGVDILQMLTKARDEYDKGKLSSEPKEIGSGGGIYANPNLIKPIPLKPKERHQPGVQDYGTQRQGQTQQDGEMDPSHLSIAALFGGMGKAASLSPQPGGNACKVASVRPAVVRSLSYDEPSPAAGGAVVSGSPTQHCSAIQKLMSGSRGPVAPLQPVSESPENRLSENGPPQSRPDPIQRLLQNAPSSSHAATYTPIPPPPLIPGLPAPQLAQGQPAPFGEGHQPQYKAPVSAQAELAFYSTSVAPSTGCGLNVGLGVVSPHELLQRLQLVQQEQNVSQEPSRLTLAPSFHKSSLQHSLSNSHNSTEPAKAQVSSPQCIPATVAPALLLSPSMFSHTKGAPAEWEEPRVLSRAQLQATLLHLIRNDATFLDTIYEAYISSLAKDTSSQLF